MKIYQVDAFTDRPFKGNPAAVCILTEEKDDGWMQNVAGEMNLSETAFLLPQKNGYYNLRWFTPTDEVDLCGHATLSSAHILWERGYIKKDQIAKFETKSGFLSAELKNNWIELNFPAEPANQEQLSDLPAELLNSLGITNPRYVGKNRLDYLIEVQSANKLKSLKPDFASLGSFLSFRGVIVTCCSDSSQYDFLSRYFAPGVGIDEDPVTGSAHCCLGPYWKEKLNKSELIGYQASKRGGIVKVTLKDDRVYLKGQAVTVLTGELLSDG